MRDMYLGLQSPLRYPDMKSIGINQGTIDFLKIVVIVRSDGLMTMAANVGGRQLVGASPYGVSRGR
jgi:hypothetical protein